MPHDRTVQNTPIRLIAYGETIAFPVALDDMASVGQPIQGCSGEPFAAEHFGPVLERQVGSHDDTGSFVGGANHIKEQFGPELAGRNIAEFIEDQQVQLGQLGFQPGQLSLFPSFDHRCYQFDDLVKSDAFAAPARLHPQGGGMNDDTEPIGISTRTGIAPTYKTAFRTGLAAHDKDAICFRADRPVFPASTLPGNMVP